jgi:hypothetical protein
MMKKQIFSLLLLVSLVAFIPIGSSSSPTQPCSCVFQSGSCLKIRITYQAPDELSCCYQYAVSGTINKHYQPCGSEAWFTLLYVEESVISSNCNALCIS